MAQETEAEYYEIPDASAKEITDVFNIIADGKDRRSIKKSLIQRFGSLDIPVTNSSLKLTCTEDGLPVEKAMPKLCLGIVVKKLVALPQWEQLASRDRRAYQDSLKQLLAGIRTIMNQYCCVEAHRPRKNSSRDAMIVDLKRQSPDKTFGEIALSYTRKTGGRITPQLAERIWKRGFEVQVDKLINGLRPDLAMASLNALFPMKGPRIRVQFTKEPPEDDELNGKNPPRPRRSRARPSRLLSII